MLCFLLIALQHYNAITLCYSIAKNCNPIYYLSSNFHVKIATKLYKIISNNSLT